MDKAKTIKINLKDFAKDGQTIFSGRPYGVSVREKIDLERIEVSDQNVFEISVPGETISLNSSFFLGLFGPSIRKFGSDGFEKRFKFLSEPHIKNNVSAGIRRALLNSSVLDEG